MRLVHAGLFAAGGAASLLGAALSAGYTPGDPRVGGLVLVGALAAAAIYLGDTARGADNLARELDAKLQRDGGLLTAWQAEQREPDAPFTRLLAKRESAQLRGAQALRCCTPHWALAVIVPLLLFAWCASVAADEEPAPVGVTPEQRLERAADALQGAAQAARERAAAPEAQADPGAQRAERAQRAAELQRMATRAKRAETPEGAGELRRDVAEQLARGGWSARERLGLEQALDSLEGLRRDTTPEDVAQVDPERPAEEPEGPGAAAESPESEAPGAAEPSAAPEELTGPGAAPQGGGAAGGEDAPDGVLAAGSGVATGGDPEAGDPAAVDSDPGSVPGVGTVQRRRREARGAEVRLLEALEGRPGWSERVPPGLTGT